MLNKDVLIQERFGSNYIVTSKGDYIGTIPEQDWRDEIVRRWNMADKEEGAVVWDLEERNRSLVKRVTEVEGTLTGARSGVARALSYIREARIRELNGESMDEYLADAERVLKGLL